MVYLIEANHLFGPNKRAFNPFIPLSSALQQMLLSFVTHCGSLTFIVFYTQKWNGPLYALVASITGVFWKPFSANSPFTCGNRSLLFLDALWFVVPKVQTELGKETNPQSELKLQNIAPLNSFLICGQLWLFQCASAVNLLKLCCCRSWPDLPF